MAPRQNRKAHAKKSSAIVSLRQIPELNYPALDRISRGNGNGGRSDRYYLDEEEDESDEEYHRGSGRNSPDDIQKYRQATKSAFHAGAAIADLVFDLWEIF